MDRTELAPGSANGKGDAGAAPGNWNDIDGAMVLIRACRPAGMAPLAGDAIQLGHSIWIAVLATKPAMVGAKPVRVVGVALKREFRTRHFTRLPDLAKQHVQLGTG